MTEYVEIGRDKRLFEVRTTSEPLFDDDGIAVRSLVLPEEQTILISSGVSRRNLPVLLAKAVAVAAEVSPCRLVPILGMIS
jgi:hypothetical protein